MIDSGEEIYKREGPLEEFMHKKSVVVFVFLFVIQALSAGLAVVPQESSSDTWQGPVLESGARSVGVLTDSQQQSMLYNQSYNGNNDNDGDGVIDSLDSDDDNDCIPDSNDTSPLDFDGDGINDESDIDDDGDGLNDSVEVNDANTSTNIYDADNDGNHDCAFFSSGSSSGGNNSGGNNSGGNNSGGNNSGGNNSGGNNSDGNNSGGNNSGGGNQTSPCGSNVNYTSVYTYSPYMVMENQSFMTSIYVNCEIYNSSMTLVYWIYDTNNYTIYSGNQSWNSMNGYSNFNWSVSGLSVGNYTFHAELYVNGSYHDSSSSGIVVYTNNSGGGGNNSGGGNQTSPCGTNLNYTSVYAYAPYMVMENQSFMTSMYVNCEILNATMTLDYWIYDSSNSTVYSGNQNWTGSSTTNSNYSWSVSGLAAGYYVFHADLYVNGTWVDSDADSFMVYANNSGGGGNNSGGNNSGGGNQTSPCGSNVNYTSVYTYSPYMVMENQSFMTSIYVNCEIYNSSMTLVYWIYDTNNYTIYSGNQSWNSMNGYSNFNWSVSGLSVGNYTFHAELYVNGSYHDSSSSGIVVYTNNSGGGGSGGNTTVNDAHCLILQNLTMSQSYYVTVNLVNTCSFGINYPGINATTSNSEVSGLYNNWWYMIGGNTSNGSGNYYTMNWQLYFSPNLTNGTIITLDFEATVMNCGSNNSWSHQCPNATDSTMSYQFTYIDNTGGNNSQLSEYIDIDHSGYAWETSEALEVWTSGTDVYVQFESGNLNIGTNYTMDWTLKDSAGSVVYNGNASWTAMYNSSIENSTISSLQDGLYTFEAYLWSDSSAGWISYDTTNIQMGNSGNGTGNNTGCGYDYNYIGLMAYAPYGTLVENQTLPMTMFVDCGVWNATMALDYWIYDENNYTVDSGNYSWVGYPSTLQWTWNASGLSAGNYTFQADVYANGVFANTSGQGFEVLSPPNTDGNNTGNNTGGNNNTHGAMFVYIQSGTHGFGIAEQFPLSLHFPAPPMGDNSPYEMSQICSVNNGHTVNVFATWVYSEGGNAGDFNNITSWSVKNSNGLQLDHFSYNPMSDIIGFVNPMVVFEDDANWSGHIPAEVFDQAAWVCVDSTTGGNNTGGNNTGGNNTGGNNTGDNTGGNNTGNNTGGNNTGDNTGGNTTTTPNSPPVVSNVSISPVVTTVDDTLTCNYDIFDANGDSTVVTVTWSVNGNVILTGSDSISDGFGVGDDVSCAVSATDGQQPSSSVSGSTVILPSPDSDSSDDEGLLPSLGTIGTMAAIAAGVFASRRKDE